MACFFRSGLALRVLVRRPKAEEETIEEGGAADREQPFKATRGLDGPVGGIRGTCYG